MSHQVDEIHILCTEPRLQKFYHDYLTERGCWGKFDTIQYENPLLDFLQPEKRAAMFQRLQAYLQLHGAHKIILFDHLDCGAYKLAGYKFSSAKEEIEEHKQNNEQIVQLLKERMPELEIEVKIINLAPDGNCRWL
jgi:Zn ribbon nucleic-acid-binding protein